MRLILAAALLAVPLAVHAQDNIPPGVHVERVTLSPGQSATFTLGTGYSHQLLRDAKPASKGSVTISYRVDGGQSTITAVSHLGYATTFSVLADPKGDGGFSPAGDVPLPGDGSTVSKTWPHPLGTVNVGNFVGGPQGGAPRP